MKQFTQVALTGIILTLVAGSQADAQPLRYPSNGPVYNQPYSVPYQSISPARDYRNDNSTYNPYHDSNDRRYDNSPSGRSTISSGRPITRDSNDRRYEDSRPGRVIRFSESRNSYGARSRVDQFASDLYRQANDICWEMHRHYKRNSNYASVYREVYDIKEVAKRMEEVVRQQNGRHSAVDDRIAGALHDMDRRFHEFQSDVRRWRPDSSYTPRQELPAMIADCEDTLHDMMDDYGLSTRHNQNSRRNDRNEAGRPNDRYAPRR